MSLLDPYRPTDLTTLPFASPTLAKVVRDLAMGVVHEHLLLFGGPGAGKSFLTELIVRTRYPQLPLSAIRYEGSAWSTTTTGTIERQMSSEKSFLQIEQHFTIINEVDKLGTKGLDALKEFMDDDDKHGSMKFLLTTNHPHKLPDNLRDRTSEHRMEMMPEQNVVALLQRVYADRGLTADPADILQLVRRCKGSWRALERLAQRQL